MNCNYKGCKECIFYNVNESKCMRRYLSPMAKDIVSSPILLEYVSTLKLAYERYLDYAFKSVTERDKGYWRGQADSILAIFNDLGFGYLLN